MADKNYVDPEGYWLDPDRGIHRESFPDPDGEQAVILEATTFCTDAEWELFRRGIDEGLCGTLDQFVGMAHSPRQLKQKSSLRRLLLDWFPCFHAASAALRIQ